MAENPASQPGSHAGRWWSPVKRQDSGENEKGPAPVEGNFYEVILRRTFPSNLVHAIFSAIH